MHLLFSFVFHINVLCTNHLCLQVKCLTLFVTHYPVLSELEQLYPDSVANYHMSFCMLDETGEGAGDSAGNKNSHLRVSFLVSPLMYSNLLDMLLQIKG